MVLMLFFQLLWEYYCTRTLYYFSKLIRLSFEDKQLVIVFYNKCELNAVFQIKLS